MKKLLSILLVLALAVSAFALAGCGSSGSSASGTPAAEAAPEQAAPAENTGSEPAAEPAATVIKVGATASPHAEILEIAKPILAAQGYELEIVVFDDYVLPNTALEDGELDANYFQHTPYLDSFNASNGTHLVSAAKVHYEPMGLFGNGVTAIADIVPGSTIVIPADDSNQTRALLLLAQEGLITLPEGASLGTGVSTLDVVDNGGFEIVPVAAETVPTQLLNGNESTLAVVNGNYALAAGLDFAKVIAIEAAEGEVAQTYANIIAVREGRENDPAIQALVSAVLSDEVGRFIAATYHGQVVAIFDYEEEAAAPAELKVIKVGATASPHAEILEQVKETLAAQGYELEIIVFDDYVLPNTALEDGELDANYFQHTPYLDSFNASNGTHLVSAAKVHYEPMGLFGNGVTAIADIVPGSTIVIPADDSNQTRALLLLAQEGLITLPEGASLGTGVDTLDVVDNGGFNIVPVAAETVPTQLLNGDESTLAVVNGNYALAAGLDFANVIAIEAAEGEVAQTYANIIAVREGNENDPAIQALIDAVLSPEVADFIADTYHGQVVAIF